MEIWAPLMLRISSCLEGQSWTRLKVNRQTWSIYQRAVSELLGHSTITFTMDVYSHVLPNMQREAVQSLDQYL